MIALSRDAELLNRVVNDPSVFPFVSLGMEGPFDMSPLVNDERNLFFANEHGGFLLINKGDRIYDIHTQFLPEGRGRSAIRDGREAMTYMFTHTDCRALMTFCPLNNKPAATLARLVGMTRFKTEVALGVAGDTYSITREEWKCQQQSH